MKRILILLSLIGLGMCCNAQTDDIERQLYQLDSLVQNEEYDKAYTFSITIDEKKIDSVSDSLQYTYYYDKLVIAYLYMNNDIQTIYYLQKAFDCREKCMSVNDYESLELLWTLGHKLKEQNDTIAALEVLENLFVFWQGSGVYNPYWLGGLYNDLADLYIMQGFTPSIEFLYKVSYDILNQNYNENFLVEPWQPMYSLGLYYENKEQYQDAIKSFDLALESSKKYSRYIYTIIANLKVIDLLQVQDTLVALNTIKDGLKYIKDTNGNYYLHNDNFLGFALEIYSIKGDEKEIDSLYTIVRDYFQYRQDKKIYVDHIYYSMQNLMNREMYDVAEKIATELIKVTPQVYGDSLVMLNVLNSSFVIKLKTLHLEECEGIYNYALSILKKLDGLNSYEYAIVQHNYGRYKMLIKDFVNAQKYLLKSKSLQMDLVGKVDALTNQYINECQKYINE